MRRITLEVCVDDAAGIAAAVEGGVDRVELCAALALGGLTPSAGLMELAKRADLPAMAMIRPRAGDFVWSPDEVEAMLVEISMARSAGMTGVVIGASLSDGRLDADTLAKLVSAARGMEITLHRAIDLTPDPVAAMELVQRLGIRRVLSSGGARTAIEGLARLAAMAKAAPLVVVMPGGGVSEANAAQIADQLSLWDIHASCSVAAPVPELPQVQTFGFQPAGARVTDASRVRALRAALDQITASRPDG